MASSRHFAIVGTVTITSAGTTSQALDSLVGFGSASDIILYTPAVLPETCVVEVCPNDDDTAFRRLYVNGGDLAVAANKAVVIPTASFKRLRVVAGVGVASDRVFTIACQVHT